MCLMDLYLCKNPFNCTLKDSTHGHSLAVQWLGQHAFTDKGAGQGTKIPQAERCGQKSKKDSALYYMYVFMLYFNNKLNKLNIHSS